MTKLSDKQRDILQLMANGKYVLERCQGIPEWYFSFEPVPPGHTWREDARTVNALEKRGLIRYGKLSDDWRSRPYHLTDKGRAALESDSHD